MSLDFAPFPVNTLIPQPFIDFCIQGRHELTNNVLRSLSNHMGISTEYLRFAYGDNIHGTAETWNDYALKRKSVTLVVTEKNEILGYAFFSINSASYPCFAPYFSPPVGSNPGIAISEIYVASTHRHKGIGKAILNEIRNIAKSTHMNYLYLACDLNNSPALWCYTKFGFKIFEYEYHLSTTKLSRNYPKILSSARLGLNPRLDASFKKCLETTVAENQKDDIFRPSISVNAGDLYTKISEAKDPIFVSADKSMAGVLKSVPSNPKVVSLSCLYAQNRSIVQLSQMQNNLIDLYNWVHREYKHDVILTRSCCISRVDKYKAYGLEPYYVSMVLRT